MRAIEVCTWWAVCLGVWLLTLSSVGSQDLIVAVPASLLCGVLAAAGRRLAPGRWRPSPRWLGWLVTLPVRVAAETAAVWRAAAATALGRGTAGRKVTLRLPPEEERSMAETRRALLNLSLSAAPGSYVMDFDAERRELLVHELVRAAPRWAQPDPDR